MHYLQVKNLHKSFWLKPLLDGVDFAITKGQKIALVARNGSGKSTLFRLLQGLEQADDGNIEFTKSVSVAFLAQQADVPGDMLTSDYLRHCEEQSDEAISGNWDRHASLAMTHWNQTTTVGTDLIPGLPRNDEFDREHDVKINKMINILNLKPLLEKKLGVLSWGELKRVQLAKSLMHEPQFLLLDEPTNHLDIDMISRLEAYLTRSHMTVFMITHDRYFLERVCTDIRELDKWRLHMYTGNYQKFLYAKSERMEREATQVHKMKQLYTAELARMRRAPSGRQTKKVDRIANFWEIKEEYNQKRDLLHKQWKKLELAVADSRLGSKVIKIHKLCKSYGERQIISHFSYNLTQWERIGILGDNGMGKSTLVNIIAGLEKYDSGEIQYGPTVSIGYYRQSEQLPESGMTILEYTKQFAEYMIIPAENGHGDRKISASHLLENFLFEPRQQQAKLFTLSGGERKRLQLCIALLKNPNVLILDEPTNDLDIETMTILEDFLQSYSWCILIISHDRYFLDKLVEHVFVFEWEGIIRDYRGNYSDYKANALKGEKAKITGEDRAKMLKSENAKMLDENWELNIENWNNWQDDEENSLLAVTNIKSKKLSYNEKREFEQLGVDIAKLDTRKDEINMMFLDEHLSTDDIVKLGKELSELVAQWEKKEARWFELAERE